MLCCESNYFELETIKIKITGITMIKNLARSIMIPLVLACSNLFAEVEYEINDIGTLQTHSSQAIALNNNGQILGRYCIDNSNDEGNFFVRDRDGSFHVLPSKESGVGCNIDWKYLTDDGIVYGVFGENNSNFSVLYMWDQHNGAVNLGNLPGSKNDIRSINNQGKVLIGCVIDVDSEGEQIVNPVIWENGEIEKLSGLEGDLGISLENAYGTAMNNNGDVVGHSLVYIVYKNNVYKQGHAALWTFGKAVDLHYTIPKAAHSAAKAVNDHGDVIIGEYLVHKDGSIVKITNMNNPKMTNNNYIYSENVVCDKKMNQIFHVGNVSEKTYNDPKSIWLNIGYITSVNDDGEVIARGVTIYGEQHAVLLTPVKAE
jgi:hypothetical protein